jgi:hypothetical protein
MEDPMTADVQVLATSKILQVREKRREREVRR